MRILQRIQTSLHALTPRRRPVPPVPVAEDALEVRQPASRQVPTSASVALQAPSANQVPANPQVAPPLTPAEFGTVPSVERGLRASR
jgi:hypothetical protein